MFDMPEMPDMDDITKQLQDAMQEAQNAMDDLPEQMEGLEEVMGSLSNMMGGLPGQLGDLTSAISGFEDLHAENSAALAGDPDWDLVADIQIGEILELQVGGSFDLKMIKSAWESTQRGDFDDVVSGIVSGVDPDVDNEMMGQILGQLKQGRSIARVDYIRIIKCTIAGAPGGASSSLEFSPEANIPLAMQEKGIGFEFAPMLTIKNQWENASIPNFSPMGEKVLVNPAFFEDGSQFSKQYTFENEGQKIKVNLQFSPK